VHDVARLFQFSKQCKRINRKENFDSTSKTTVALSSG